MLIYIVVVYIITMMENKYLGNIFLVLKTLGILYVFYLDYCKKINLPLLAILFILIGSFGMSAVGSSSKESPVFNYHYHNFVTGLAGMLLIIKKYM